ncbi:MAG TPA: acyltransferase [Stellaceae bacterium]|nr:acyltransferase [Stellaceae bacterium]
MLDSWRGICAVMVALYHLGPLGHLYAIPLVGGSFLFVDFFFVLSGFVITHAYADRIHTWRAAGTFMIRRFGRLWPLHFLMLSAFVLLEGTRATLESVLHLLPSGAPPFSGDLAPNTIVNHALLMNSWGFEKTLAWNGPSWSIGAEFYTYLVFAAACVLAHRHLPRVAALTAILAGFLVAMLSPKYMNVTYDYGFIRCLYGFFVGLVIYKIYLRYHESSLHSVTLSEAAIACVAIGFVSYAAETPLSLLAPVFFGALVLVFAFERGRLSRALSLLPFQKLGTWSYSIYMVHAFVLSVVDHTVRQVEKFTGHSYHAEAAGLGVLSFGNAFVDDVFALAYICVVVGVASLTYRLIEIPGRRFFNSLASSLSAESVPMVAKGFADTASTTPE